MMWIYFLTLFLPEAWSLGPGTNDSTAVNTTTFPPPPIYADRNKVFTFGSDVNLTCSDKTWNELLFVIWKIQFSDKKNCEINFSDYGQSENSCKDKSLRNTSSGQSYLYIPKFSPKDVGDYKCESAYRGGIENYNIHVDILVPPKTYARIEHRDNKTVAVCVAEGGNPAANISWSYTGKMQPVEKKNTDGFVTIESHLELSEGTDIKHLNCTISHQSWEHVKILYPWLSEPQKSEKGYHHWLYILTAAIITVFLAGFLLFAQKKFIKLRQCEQSDAPSSKSPPIEDVEEVEPYASYIQRVNSIYN